MHQIELLNSVPLGPPDPPERGLLEAFGAFLRLDVAQGDASFDTVRGYHTQVRVWLAWCAKRGVNAARATHADVKAYRQALIEAGYKSATIAFKLTIVRRCYQAAQHAGLRADNPAAGVKPPRDKRPVDDVLWLSEEQLTRLLRGVDTREGVKAFRDRALLGLMGLHGLRTVEVERANVDDMQTRAGASALLVHGKGRDRWVYLRDDVHEALSAYLEARGEVQTDAHGTPLFGAVGNHAGGTRLSRRGVRQVVDFYLVKARLKRHGLSGHALRHTAATLGYKHTQDLRAVQDMLGHQDPKTTARYAHLLHRAQHNPACAVPVSLAS